MASIQNPLRRGLLTAETSKEGDRATTLELFFDLVYVFAFTQVTALMYHGYEEGDGAIAVVQGLVILALVWWSWTSYTWLANQAHADRGIVRVGVMLAIVLMFLLSLVVPEAYHDLEGGLFAPLVFVVAYVAVRVVHAVVYMIAAGSDTALRRQVVVSMFSALLPATAVLVVGAFLGEPYQVWIWLVAIALDLTVVRLTSSGGSWRINSVSHFAERHGLVVILALGESVVAIGLGVAQLPITAEIVVGSVLSVGICIALWWVYFGHAAPELEHRIARIPPAQRLDVATDVYTYLHLSLVAGIVLAALGIEQAMAHLEGGERLGAFGAAALGGGISLYLAGTAVIWRRATGQWAVIRFAGATLALAAIPVAAATPAMASLGVACVALVVLMVAEAVIGPRGKLSMTRAEDAAEHSGGPAPSEVSSGSGAEA